MRRWRGRAETYEERAEFVLRFSLEARFPESYEGEADGYAWLRRWEEVVKPDVIAAVFAALGRHPGWTARVRQRGISHDREIEIVVEVPVD